MVKNFFLIFFFLFFLTSTSIYSDNLYKCSKSFIFYKKKLKKGKKQIEPLYCLAQKYFNIGDKKNSVKNLLKAEKYMRKVLTFSLEKERLFNEKFVIIRERIGTYYIVKGLDKISKKECKKGIKYLIQGKKYMPKSPDVLYGIGVCEFIYSERVKKRDSKKSRKKIKFHLKKGQNFLERALNIDPKREIYQIALMKVDNRLIILEKD